MGEIQDLLGQAHSECDNHLVAAEAAVAEADWTQARAHWTRFVNGLTQHLLAEEQVLFPAIERVTDLNCGPTQVMRMDHEQMRALLQPIETAIINEDEGAFLPLSETMLMLIQQHNMKEEQVLYPMAEEMLPDPGAVLSGLRDCAGSGTE